MTEKDSRRGVVTEENREESRRLKEIWTREQARLKREGHGTQDAFAAEFKIGNQSAVGNMLNGRQKISPRAALKFAHALNCDVRDFSPRLDAELLPPPKRAAAGFSEGAIEVARLYDQLDQDGREHLRGLLSALQPRTAKV